MFVPFAGLLPRGGCVAVSSGADPRAVCRFTRRSGFAARSAGPEICKGRLLVVPGISRRASSAAKRGNDDERRPTGRSIEDGSVRLLGLFSPPAIRALRCSSRPPRAILPWAFASLRCDGCDAPRYSACTNGRARTACRVPSVVRRRISRPASAHGLCVSSVGLAADPVSNTEVRRLSSRSRTRRPFAVCCETRRVSRHRR